MIGPESPSIPPWSASKIVQGNFAGTFRDSLEGKQPMKTLRWGIWMAAGLLVVSVPAIAQNENEGQGRAVVTVLARHEADTPASVPQRDLKVEVNGKKSTVTGWKSLQGTVELVVLMDSSSRSSLGTQLEEVARFIQRLPPNVRVAVAYMQNGQAHLTGPLSDDRTTALHSIHLPGGGPGSSGSPYFCLSDLAQHWPSADTSARREVVMVTDGVDNFERRFDPGDPYVDAAIKDSVRAGLIVYALYWHGRGPGENADTQTDSGQNLLLMVTDATGGKSYWEGFGNPVSFEPYFTDLNRRLANQYELSFLTPLNGKSDVASMKLHFAAPGEKADAPHEVMVFREGVAQQ